MRTKARCQDCRCILIASRSDISDRSAKRCIKCWNRWMDRGAMTDRVRCPLVIRDAIDRADRTIHHYDRGEQLCRSCRVPVRGIHRSGCATMAPTPEGPLPPWTH